MTALPNDDDIVRWDAPPLDITKRGGLVWAEKRDA